MGDYFKPLRRKIGVVTLVMACGFAAGWVRSRTLVDNPYCPTKTFQTVGLRSQDSLLGIVWVKNNALGAIPVMYAGWDKQQFKSIHDWASLMGGWRCYFLGFGSVSRHVPDETSLRAWFIPYWSIVIPLTLLSAYLLLTKLRKSKQKEITEPIATEGM